MQKLTVADLVKEIGQLDTQQIYSYFSGRSQLQITQIKGPEGPIIFKRWDSRQSIAQSTEGSISINQLGTVTSVFSAKPNYPIHFDRLFSAGGNLSEDFRETTGSVNRRG